MIIIASPFWVVPPMNIAPMIGSVRKKLAGHAG
jgi:hypothetical protein